MQSKPAPHLEGSPPFRLRMEFFPDDDLTPSTVVFAENIASPTEAQRTYVMARESSMLGASRFLPGELFDASGNHVGRISYNGRLWKPEPLQAGMTPIAEAPPMEPGEEDLVWMVGTRHSAPRDGWIAGPDSSPHILKLGMEEGQVLVGKDRRGEVRVVQVMGPDGLVDLRGGLEALREDDGPSP